MCGYIGFINFDKQNTEQNNIQNLNKMLNVIKFRGPDDTGVWNYKNLVFMGHNRLSIMDLSKKASQPMISQNARYVIAYNGEIYNHLKLRQNIKDHKKFFWNSTSDTETIIEHMCLFGIEKSLESFEGMFSFALYDKIENKLFLARDKMGEKPLYYGFNSNIFYFGSDLKSFYESDSFKLDVNYASLSSFLKYGFISDPDSIVKNIFKLNKSSYLELDLNYKKTKLRKYKVKNLKNYDLKNFQSEKDWLKELEILLFSSVNSQLISDVDVGTFLSGGIDSTLISTIANTISDTKINTFSIGFENPEYDESKQARKISNIIKSNHNEYILRNKDIEETIYNIANAFSEPFSDSSQIPTMILSKFSSQKNKVVLTGDGADELFGGYNRYIFVNYYSKYIKKIPFNLRKKITNILRGKGKNFVIFLFKFINVIIRDNKQTEIADRLDKFFNMIESENENQLYSFLSKNNSSYSKIINQPTKDELPFSNNQSEWPTEFMERDINNYLTNDILVKVDRSAMFSSLETRAPYLDQNLINFSNILPLNLKIKNSKKKYILSELLKKLLPSYNFNYPKKGFSIPLDHLMKNELKDFTFNLLGNDEFYKDDFLNKDEIINLFLEHQNNKKNNSHILWNLIVYFSWRQKYKI